MTRPAVQGMIDIERLYAKHRDPLLRWFVRRTGDSETAVDLWAQTFAQALISRQRFRGETEEEAAGWLYGIAKHELATYHRRGKAEQRALARLGLERPEVDSSLLSEIERRSDLAALHTDIASALAGLSAPVREAVELRVVQDLSYNGLATRLGITEAAARARVSRGLTALAEALEPTVSEEALTL